mmetsp:Transcript_31305/g.28488  ORF Transcript_31305/g.28488 Transcript_31305/m.28488 type:complete len:243 (-) Transcript_31305:15-743(-)
MDNGGVLTSMSGETGFQSFHFLREGHQISLGTGSDLDEGASGGRNVSIHLGNGSLAGGDGSGEVFKISIGIGDGVLVINFEFFEQLSGGCKGFLDCNEFFSSFSLSVALVCDFGGELINKAVGSFNKLFQVTDFRVQSVAIGIVFGLEGSSVSLQIGKNLIEESCNFINGSLGLKIGLDGGQNGSSERMAVDLGKGSMDSTGCADSSKHANKDKGNGSSHLYGKYWLFFFCQNNILFIVLYF